MKVIFADFANVRFNGVIQKLAQDGIIAEAVMDAEKLIAALSAESYELCVFNLMLGGVGPFEMIGNLRACSKNPKVKIIVVSRQIHKANIQNSLKAGADDFIGEPFEAQNLYTRIRYHLGSVRVIKREGYESAVLGTENRDLVYALLESTELLSRTEREHIHKSCFQILSKVASLTQSNRTSLMIVDMAENAGVILASSDDANFHNFPINLDKYPEILHVVNQGQLVVIEDVTQNTLTEAIKANVKTIAIGSMMVFPVSFQGDVVGALNIRRPEATEVPSLDVLRILQAIANLMAAHSYTAFLLRKIYRGYTAPKKAA